jgi:hypothetical protein
MINYLHIKMKYIILSAHSLSHHDCINKLTALVNNKLKEGYVLNGSISSYVKDNFVFLLQPMYKPS